jgi:hypothetical protein
MATRFELYHRLEPARPGEDLVAGLREEIHDPLWFLARQLLLGEHRGEDASSPVRVDFAVAEVPIDPYQGDATLDPAVVPPEAIIEAEPDSWWTPGRRIALGRSAGAGLGPVSGHPELQLRLPPPYDRLSGGQFDGYLLYAQRTQLGLDPALFDDVPAEQPDLWDPAELFYSATFTAGGSSLALPRHDGGDVDWYSVDADAPVPAPALAPTPRLAHPSRMRYPGAAAPRLWEIEDGHVDIGGYPPDRSHFATMLLIDLIVSHSDDWFVFPVDASTATVATLVDVTVRDSFGDTWTLSPPTGWTLYAVNGLDPSSLLLWPTVATPLTGDLVEQVVLGVDEDANVLWAVERRVDGLEVPTPEDVPTQPAVPAGSDLDASATPSYRYIAERGAHNHWHPYVVDAVAGRRRFVQGRLADLTVRPARLMDEPRARVLQDPGAPATGPQHQIEPGTLPTQGLDLERRWMLGRRADAKPVLWLQRRRKPLAAGPSSGLRFDLLEQVPEVAP